MNTTYGGASRETVGCAHGSDPAAPPRSVSRETDAIARPGPIARVFLLPIRGYRRFLSPALAPRCRYYPSCSAYAEEAIRELGVIRGTILAAWRIVRCNPLSDGGLDPLSERRLFRPTPKRAETP